MSGRIQEGAKPLQIKKGEYNTICFSFLFYNFVFFKGFKQELAFASHLGLPAILIQLKHGKNANLARCLSEQIQAAYFQQVRTLYFV